MDQKNNTDSIVCASKPATNYIESAIRATEGLSRMIVRVKRRRSRSPAEALLLTENVTSTKRAKIGNGVTVN